MSESTVAIALACFNGEKFIEEQIASIQASHFSNWVLIIGDDGSQDNTIEIIQKIQSNDQRIILLESETEEPLGHCLNFNRILSYILNQGFDVFFLADQDDYWKPEKLTLQLNKISISEQPYLIYSDLEIVNHNLITRSKSFIKYHNLNPVSGKTVNYLLLENCVTGCTIMGNKKLLEIALPFPESLHNHDWWLALVAACSGKIHYIDKPLTKYRQHSDNLIGSNSYREIVFSPNIQVHQKFKKHIKQFADHLHTLNILTNRLKVNSIQSEPTMLIQLFVDICTKKETFISKILKLYLNGFRTHHIVRWFILLNNLRKVDRENIP